jgi:glyoxylate/hydroxypyruvate reductase
LKKLAIVTDAEYVENWVALLKNRLYGYEIYGWPDIGEESEIDVLLTWNHPPGTLRRFSNLKLIISLGAGVDHIVSDPDISLEVPIVRLITPSLTSQMAEYVCLSVLLFQRRFLDYLALKKSCHWKELPASHAADFTVGVMGLGVLGSYAAEKLTCFSFPIRGWSRTEKSIEGVECFNGRDQFDLFLSKSNILVCLLPLTNETKGILNKTTFSVLPKGSFVINVGRGKHLVEEDLIESLDSGQIAGACLDVFQNEPLSANSPLWRHPNIVITPHISAISMAEDVVKNVVNSVDQLELGAALNNVVSVDRGY